MKKLIAALALSVMLGACGTIETNYYDKEGNLVQKDVGKGTEVTTHQAAKVAFKKADGDRIAAQSTALKELGNSMPEGTTHTEAMLMKVIIADNISDLKPQDYGEAAPQSPLSILNNLVNKGLMAFGIDRLADFGEKAIENAGDKQYSENGDVLKDSSIDKSEHTEIKEEASSEEGESEE